MSQHQERRECGDRETRNSGGAPTAAARVALLQPLIAALARQLASDFLDNPRGSTDLRFALILLLPLSALALYLLH